MLEVLLVLVAGAEDLNCIASSLHPASLSVYDWSRIHTLNFQVLCGSGLSTSCFWLCFGHDTEIMHLVLLDYFKLKTIGLEETN